MIRTRASSFLTSWTTYQSQTSTIQSVSHEKPQPNTIHIQLSTLETREIGRTSRKEEEGKMSAARRMEKKQIKVKDETKVMVKLGQRKERKKSKAE